MAFFGSKTVLGLDIGTSSVKVVEMTKSSGRFVLQNYGILALAPGAAALKVSAEQAVTTGTVRLSEEDIAWAVRTVLEKSKIESREAMVSIPSYPTFTTVITMPYVSEEEIAKAIPYEARKYVPVPLSDVVLDWSIINVNGPAKGGIVSDPKLQKDNPASVEVFLVAVPKEEIKRYQTIMKLAVLTMKVLELESFALVRAIVGNDLSPLAVINIGGRSTSIVIVDGGVERINHDFEIGGSEVTKSIAQMLKISSTEAEELKRVEGLKSDRADLIAAIADKVDKIVLETKKVVQNYEETKKVKIAKIMLVGGLANMPGLIEYFQNKASINVTLGNALARVIVAPELAPIQNELNLTLAVAVGLAMRET